MTKSKSMNGQRRCQMRFRLGDIRDNPFRCPGRYPERKDTVQALQESIDETGFWDNVVARIRKDGRPEIAYGHHRLRALRKEYDGDHKVGLIIRDLSDDQMIKIMARENMDEAGHDFRMLMETVRSVVHAYADGKIALNYIKKPRATDNKVRFAPWFRSGYYEPSTSGDDSGREFPYTADLVARYLGWMQRNGKRWLRHGDRPQQKVGIVFGALCLVEEGKLDDSDFDGLSIQQATRLIDKVKKTSEPQKKAGRESDEPDIEELALTVIKQLELVLDRDRDDLGKRLEQVIQRRFELDTNTRTKLKTALIDRRDWIHRQAERLVEKHIQRQLSAPSFSGAPKPCRWGDKRKRGRRQRRFDPMA